MNERVLNLLSMCMQAKEKGHHAFFDYSPHVDSGEVGYMESSFAEVEAYLKELLA